MSTTPSPTPPPNSHFVRKVKLRLAYRLAFVIESSMWIQLPTMNKYFETVRSLYQAHLHQTPLTPDTFCTCRILGHQPAFTTETFYTTQVSHLSYIFYTNQLLPQTPFTPTSFYTRHLLHQPAFTLDTLYTRNLSRDTFHTRHSLHQTPFTRSNFFTPHILLHQTPFTPEAFYTKHLTSTDFYTTPFIPNLHTCPYTFTPTSFDTRHLWHQPAFTRDTFYTNQLLHQTAFTIFHTRHPLHQTALTRGNFLHHNSFYTRHLLHQTPWTPNTLYINRLLHHIFQTYTFYTKRLLEYPRQADQGGFEPLTSTHRTKMPSGTNGCQTLTGVTLNTFYFCQKKPLCQPPPSPTPPPNSHFVRKVKLRLAYRLAFVTVQFNIMILIHWVRTILHRIILFNPGAWCRSFLRDGEQTLVQSVYFLQTPKGYGKQNQHPNETIIGACSQEGETNITIWMLHAEIIQIWFHIQYYSSHSAKIWFDSDISKIDETILIFKHHRFSSMLQ